MKKRVTTKWARSLVTWTVALILCLPLEYPIQPGVQTIGPPPAQAEEDPQDDQIAALRQRVQDLEEQNRHILELVRGLQGQQEAAAVRPAVAEGPVPAKEAPVRCGQLGSGLQYRNFCIKTT